MGQELETVGFPTAFPMNSFAAVLKIARGGVTSDERRELALHVWIVAGWLLNAAFEKQVFGDASGGDHAAILNARLAMEQFRAEADRESSEGCLPLMILVPIAIELVKWWLARRED